MALDLLSRTPRKWRHVHAPGCQQLAMRSAREFDDRGKSTRGLPAVGAMRKEPLRLAARANSTYFDVFVWHSCLAQRFAISLPKVQTALIEQPGTVGECL